MELAARAARFGDRLVSFLAAVLILLLLAYGGYSLWDTVMVYQGAFLSNDLLQYKPAADGGDNLSLAELQAINPDVRGWLTIDDTHIDYPVVQGEDDMEYINKDVKGEFALSGAIFVAADCAGDFTDAYTLVYGHHMDNGGMFGDVVEFTDAEYFNAHQTGTLYLPDATYSITLFACLQCDAYDTVVYDTGASAADASTLLTYLREHATNYRDIGAAGGDRIIGLSTCTEAETNGRVVLFGRLEPVSDPEGGK